MSGDFDPRDLDSRERDDGIHDREDEWLTLGRGPGAAVVRDRDEDVRERDDDWGEERDREPRDRDDDRGSLDPRDVFMHDLDLPRGPERELVHDRDRDYTLNGSESRTLSTVGAFRVVSEHDLKLLRKMFAWGIRERLLNATPFKVAGENVIRLDPESPREERLTDPEAERKLFDAASPHLRGVITAMLETCCRPGEILSLQWQDVDLETRELTIRAEKAKTRRARRLPISSRLLAVLEMRKLDPAGKPFPPDAYVFGNRLGKRVTSIRTAWENAREAAGLNGFQLRDLRHEAASRFEEAGVLTTDVSKFLGHRNLSTTTRYLNTTSRRLRLALLRVEQARAQSESLANSCKETPDAVPHADDAEASSTPSKSAEHFFAKLRTTSE